ncbi:MAG: META domain-containing protein [Aeromonas popoffii]|uniref:META domain-containing protein n=1 Tax=Aeromonas popoffii TaxID=70856 RepID=UPI003F3EE109
MLKTSINAAILLASVLPAFTVFAAEPQLICFGNEPSWSLQFSDKSRAQLLLPEHKAVDFLGQKTHLLALKEYAWRGKPVTGKGGEAVALLREESCSDGMSNTQHPMSARVSLPDGQLLAGCCRVPKPAKNTTDTTTKPLTLEGPTWQLDSPGGSFAGIAIDAEKPVTVRFEAGRLSGFSGCNRLMGGYNLSTGKVKISMLAGSMMACPEPQTALENAVRAALSGTLAYAINTEQLSLSTATGAVLTFKAQPAATLEGVYWDVTGFNNGRQAVVSALPGTRLSMVFEQGQVHGSSGCNTYQASFTSVENRLSIGPLLSTRMVCPADGVMQQEREFLAALESVKLWEIRDGLLDAHRADGERVFNAVVSAP